MVARIISSYWGEENKINKPAYLNLIKIKFKCASFGTTELKQNNYIIVKNSSCTIMIRIVL